eukprot:scaffold19179_cov149-Skeletonema_menzelii.AAC.15
MFIAEFHRAFSPKQCSCRASARCILSINYAIIRIRCDMNYCLPFTNLTRKLAWNSENEHGIGKKRMDIIFRSCIDVTLPTTSEEPFLLSEDPMSLKLLSTMSCTSRKEPSGRIHLAVIFDNAHIIIP